MPQEEKTLADKELDPELVKFLTDLDTDQVKALKEMLKWYQNSKTVGKFLFWCWITVVTMFIGAMQLGQHLSTVIKWLTSTGAPK